MIFAMISGHFVFYYPSQFATFSFCCIKTQRFDFDLIVGALTPLSTIFQLYHDDQF